MALFWFAIIFFRTLRVGLGADSAAPPAPAADQAAGSTITLHLHSATPARLFAELSKQIKYDLHPDPVDLFESDNRSIADIDLQGVPFWEAMPVIFGKTGFDVAAEPGGFFVTRQSQRGKCAWCVSGGVLAMAWRVIAEQKAEFTDSPRGLQAAQRSGHLKLILRMNAEPGIRVYQSGRATRPRELLDKRGAAIAFQDASPHGGGVFGGQPNPNTWLSTLDLNIADRLPARIAHLKATTEFTIGESFKTFEINNPLHAHDVKLEAGHHSLAFAKLMAQGGGYRVYFEITSDPEYMDLVRCAARDIQLFDAAGHLAWKPTGAADHVRLVGNPNQWFLDLAPVPAAAAATPAKLVWLLPEHEQNVSCPLDFHDLRLD